MSLATAEMPLAEAEGRLADKVGKIGGPSLEAMEDAAAPVIRRLGKKFPAVASRSITRMRTTLDDLQAGPTAGDAMEKIFAEAHDIRGQARTFGFGSLGQVASSLCEFIIRSEEVAQKRKDLVEVHIDAMELCLQRETEGNFEGLEADELMANLEKAVATVRQSAS